MALAGASEEEPFDASAYEAAELLARLLQAEEARAASERRWQRLLECSSDSIAVIGVDGKVLVDTGIGTLGDSSVRAESVSGAMGTVVHPDDVERATQVWMELLSTPGPQPPLLLRLRQADGTWRWRESYATNLLHDPEVAGIVVTTRDVTEREAAVQALRDETRVLERLHTIGTRLAGELDLDALLQEISDAVTWVTDANFGAFLSKARVDEGSRYEFFAVTGAPTDIVDSTPDGVGPVVAPVLNGSGTLRIDDLTAEPWATLIAPTALDIRSFLGVPVVSRTGHVHGGVFVGHTEPAVFTERAERLAAGIAAYAAIAIDNALLYQAAHAEIDARRVAEEELAHQATHDPLTGLPNRILLHDRLAQAVAHLDRGGRRAAVLLLDLDRFKVVNDSLGHAAGDHILVTVAERLVKAVRPGDTVARLGGDEFVVVCDDLHGELDAVGLADRVASAFKEPFALLGRQLRVAASIGIAIARDHTSRPEDLLRDADAVMYRSKAHGGGRWEIFDDGLRDRVVERLRVETELQQALEAAEMALYFQPVVSLATNTVVGAEGLARWEHPERGLVLPNEFIQVAEESGLIVPLGGWVIQEGCRQLARWAKDDATADRTVSVNVSARQLPDLVRTVRQYLASTNADPRQLSLEITETALMDDVEAAGDVLARLRMLGVQVWVDDFGTGYASLTYLRRLPITGLKIDRSFVAGLDTSTEDRAIVGGIIGLAHSLGLVALAEGVETEYQADRLRDLGCDLAQGFLWSAAVPTDDRALR